MPRDAADIIFSAATRAVQTRKGSRALYAKRDEGRGWRSAVTPQLESFVAELDMFYLGTAGADGRPYIQYRGGPPGFLKVTGEHTLAFADFAGNRQYITLGNLSENPRAFIFLMDYVHRRRIKVWGRARVVEDDPELLARLTDPDYPAQPERAILFTVEAWDVNCPQHIHQRLAASEVAPVIEGLQARIDELETEVNRLQSAG